MAVTMRESKRHPQNQVAALPKTMPKPTPAPAAPAAAANGPRIQLASVRTPEAAREEWARLKHDNPDLLGKLTAKLDRALIEHKAAELRAWVTFLSDDQVSLDPKVVQWSKKHGWRSS